MGQTNYGIFHIFFFNEAFPNAIASKKDVYSVNAS